MKTKFYLFLLLVSVYCFHAPIASSVDRVVKVNLSKNPPLVFTDDKGEAAGIYVDIIKYIAKKEGWVLQFEPCKWRECLEKLEDGTIDFLMSVAYSEARGGKMDFTTETVFNNWAYVYRKPGSNIESVVDLDGKKVATLKGNVHSRAFVNVINSFGVNSEIVDVDDYIDVFRSIDDGSAVAGVVTAYSEPGRGSTFNVYLPIIERRQEPRAEAEGSIPSGSERILFVDDEPALANIGKRTLKPLGYDVETRTSSIEALELFKAQPDRFDLVITDMTMPNMTGEDLAKELMRIKPNIPIILCTGFSAKIDDQKAGAMGIRAFVLKPIVKREIATKIRKVLDGK